MRTGTLDVDLIGAVQGSERGVGLDDFVRAVGSPAEQRRSPAVER
jgi:hypothetical protein